MPGPGHREQLPHRPFNGDIGICLRDEGGTLMAWFPSDDPRNPRPFHPAALPARDSAMTAHKAQGSEFDEVSLVLPELYNRMLSRNLVYAGMNRSRRALRMAGSADVIRGGVGAACGAVVWLGVETRAIRQPDDASYGAETTMAGAVFKADL